MIMIITLIVISAALLEFSYFYLRLRHPVWPFDNLPLPGLPACWQPSACLVRRLRRIRRSSRYISQEKVTGMRVALAVAFLLGALAVGCVVVDFVNCLLTTRSMPMAHSTIP